MSQAEFKKRLKRLMLLPENQVCSDCPERQPRWASLIKPPPGAPPGTLPIGAFCCLECSGSHRRLGVHISFVRSVSLDQWKESEVLAMENGGNAKVNEIFEAHLNVQKPSNAASGSVRERFVRDKYERRKFYDTSAFERVSQREIEREQNEVVSGVQRQLASRKPSDAARKRVEERAARNKSSHRAPAPSRVVAARTPAPPPVAAPVEDLLDFGNFDSLQAKTAVQQADVAAPAQISFAEPQLDFFATPQEQDEPAAVQQPTTTQLEQQKMSNADIMSMFNTPQTNTTNQMQQNMFAGGIPSQMGGMPNQMGGMPNQMGGLMGGQPQWSPNMMPQSQMMQQQQNMGTMNPNMMMQGQMGMNQPQMMGMQPSNIGMQNGYGMQNGNMSMHRQNNGQQQQQSVGKKIDQFAEFGSF